MAGECLHCGVYFELCCVPAGVQPECVPAFIDGLLQRCDGGDQQGRGRALLRTDCRFVLSLFTGKYRIAGYELSDENVHQLNRLKGYYRFAWILTIASLAGMIYSFRRLWRRRETMPCFYGSAGGACLVALLMLRIVTSKREVYAGLRNMIFRGDYGYFSSGDVLCKILPETFARNLALLYLGIVAAEIFVFVMIRVCVRLAGRPHRF